MVKRKKPQRMSTHPCGAELWGVLIFYLIEFYAA
jgi:hypothetical protein